MYRKRASLFCVYDKADTVLCLHKEEKVMKIVVLEGSPNKNGSSNMLAAEFIRGGHRKRDTACR